MGKKTVSLVLGSGGARGLAHVGIIRYLEENDYEIKSISGCSIGALIGGFYAAGKLDVYVKWLEDVDTFDMLKLLDFKGTGGLISGESLMDKLKELIGDYEIESLPINFTAVATDINAEKEVWINKGSLLNAIRASISLPLFFTPYLHNNKLLIDGGALNPVPIAPTFHDETDITISVNLGGESCNNFLIEEDIQKTTLKDTIKEYMTKLSIPESLLSKNNMYFIANKSFETMQGNLARMKLSVYPPDIEIDIPRNLCGTFEFNKASKVIEFGYNLCSKNPHLFN